MSLLYIDNNNNEKKIAATISNGELVPSVSHYQSGYLNFNNLTETYKDITVLDMEHPSVQYKITFDTPMPDDDFVVIVDVHNTNLQVEVASENKTINGFIVTVRNLVATMRADRKEITDGFIYPLLDDYFNWRAFKLMSDMSYALDSAQITQNTEDIAELKESNKGYAWAGTTAEWNVLSDGEKEKLDGKEILITDDEGSSGLDDRVTALEDGEQIAYSDTFSFGSATNGSAIATESGIYAVCLSKNTTNMVTLKDTTINKVIAQTDAYASSAQAYTLTVPIIKGHSYTLTGQQASISYQSFVKFCK